MSETKKLRVNQIKVAILDIDEAMIGSFKVDKYKTDSRKIEKAVKKALRLPSNAELNYSIFKSSIDARKKPELYYVYTVDVDSVSVNNKSVGLEKVLNASKNKNAAIVNTVKYIFPTVEKKMEKRPVIVGFGPAGMFAALKLAEAGLKPIVYERGHRVEERQKKVTDFWTTGIIDTESNVSFGEGGAGTFSDGKLNTVIKDPTGRIRDVLETFVRFGADESILYDNKPHIGTDVLVKIVKNIREHIKTLGGEIFFNHRLENIDFDENGIRSIKVLNKDNNDLLEVATDSLCLAIGHSARDTFTMLNAKGVVMEPKAFAVGVRIEHPQSFVNENAYGVDRKDLPTAAYKVTYQTNRDNPESSRGVYSFCMCPGGYVVNASTEDKRIAVNGMSYSDRASTNSNSAMIVTVTPKDFGGGVLDGVEFQRKLEKNAYNAGNGSIPVQIFEDFEQNRVSTGLGSVKPCIKGAYNLGNLNDVFPEYINAALVEGIHGISRSFKGFDMPEAVLSGVESRTSSPVKILRNEDLSAFNIKGLYPCGEGAGYAGGITSAAVDGIKVAEKMCE